MSLIEPVASLDLRQDLFRIREGAVEVLDSFFRERREREAAQAKKRVREKMEQLNESERTLLAYFGRAQLLNEHAEVWMDYGAYCAIPELVSAGVIEHSSGRQSKRSLSDVQESIRVHPDAIPLVEELVLHQPIAQTVLSFDASNIKSTVPAARKFTPMVTQYSASRRIL